MVSVHRSFVAYYQSRGTRRLFLFLFGGLVSSDLIILHVTVVYRELPIPTKQHGLCTMTDAKFVSFQFK